MAEDAVIADKPLSRMKGLLGRKELKAGQAVVLRPCNSVHTFFMRFSIDVIFVDKKNRVVKTISSLASFRLTRIYFSSSFAIELPAGTILSSSTRKGDLIGII